MHSVGDESRTPACCGDPDQLSLFTPYLLIAGLEDQR